MVRVSEESVFPASRAELWRVLELHFDDDAVREIHPAIELQRRMVADHGASLFERKVRNAGRRFTLTTKYDTIPMDMFRWEITASSGGIAAGSYIENRYSDAGEGKTKMVTKGELGLHGVPGFLQGAFVRRLLSQWDDEDLRYLVKTSAIGGVPSP